MNKDYFNDDQGVKPKLLSRKQEDMFGRKNQVNQRQNPKEMTNKSPIGLYQGSDYNSNKINTKNERDGNLRRMKSPRTMVHPIEKMMSRDKKTLTKMNSAKSLEYTFGFQ